MNLRSQTAQAFSRRFSVPNTEIPVKGSFYLLSQSLEWTTYSKHLEPRINYFRIHFVDNNKREVTMAYFISYS